MGNIAIIYGSTDGLGVIEDLTGISENGFPNEVGSIYLRIMGIDPTKEPQSNYQPAMPPKTGCAHGTK
ncbi:MAG: hypothetical protein KAT91_01080 [Candidatus Aenigmarchaeota archaeon]|nr:hypothetical protein [Candidatus Aenigmarchaeota archaeon]